MAENEVIMWIGFSLVLVVMFIVDLGIINRKVHVISFKEATLWSVTWISLAILFNIGIVILLGYEKGLDFFTAYLIEKSLSIDNIFVFIMLFSFFNIKPEYQPIVLKWGIIGAIVMRAIMIFVGIELLEMFHWMIYLFGGLLILTGIKMIISHEKALQPEKNPVIRIFRKIMPITKDLHKNRFFVRVDGILHATPLFVVLLLIEVFDLVFAIDSIPAVLSITKDPFIVYTSNIFAILGLRALFFMVANVITLFAYLKTGISVILCFVGVKMVISDIYKLPTSISLLFIFIVLTISILSSLIIKKKSPA